MIFIILFKTFQSSFLFFFPFRILLWSLSEELRILVLHSGPFLGFIPVMGSITFINVKGDRRGFYTVDVCLHKQYLSFTSKTVFLIVSGVCICAVFSSETSSSLSLPNSHDNDGDEEKNNHHQHSWLKNTHKTIEWMNNFTLFE